MLAGLIISTPSDTPLFTRLLGDGVDWGLDLQYKVQPPPDGLAQAFIIGSEFIGQDHSALILGDNIFYGHDFSLYLQRAAQNDAATVVAYHVSDPERYGVVTFDDRGRAVSLEEKPKQPQSSFAVTGLYFYDPEVTEIAASLKPSARGELEITDLNRVYLERDKLSVEILGRGFAWLDTGTTNLSSRLQISLKRSSAGRASKSHALIGIEQVAKLAEPLTKNDYGRYLLRIVEDEHAMKTAPFATALECRCLLIRKNRARLLALYVVRVRIAANDHPPGSFANAKRGREAPRFDIDRPSLLG
jgi:glucose-1-phosphate thymidylyltransferase